MTRLNQNAAVDVNGRQIQKFMDQYEFQWRNLSNDLVSDPEYILSVHADGGFVIQKHHYPTETAESMLYYIERTGRDPQEVYDTFAPTLEYLGFYPALVASRTREV